MPEKQTIERARRDAAEASRPRPKPANSCASRSPHPRGRTRRAIAKQAIAIGLSEARRAGVPLSPPKGQGRITQQARRDLKAGQQRRKTNPKRSRAVVKALQKEGRSAASHRALSRQAKQAARRRSPAARSQAAKKAARTRRRAAS